MAERRLELREAIEAYISKNGMICLKQEDLQGHGDTVIYLTAADVPVVVRWLQELAEELNTRGK